MCTAASAVAQFTKVAAVDPEFASLDLEDGTLHLFSPARVRRSQHVSVNLDEAANQVVLGLESAADQWAIHQELIALVTDPIPDGTVRYRRWIGR